MNTDHQTRHTSQQLVDQIIKHIEILAQETDAARMSQEMLRYLEMCARFHNYSWCNTWLIFLACPHATHVAGYRKWQSMNRFVRKGEHGIPILAPILITETDKGESQREEAQKRFLRGFTTVHVFDISQTDGEPLPEPPDWKSPEKDAILKERLIAFAQERSITVTEKVLAGEIQGVSSGGSIDLSPEAGTSTLIHEIAHELMHHNPDAPAERSIRELEAEAAAFVVSSHFGLESNGSPNYIALHGASSELILKHLERISKTSAEIIEAIENPS